MVASSLQGKGLTIVVNPRAGDADSADEVDRIRQALPNAEVVQLEESDSIEEVFRRSAERSTALGVHGGDGTTGAAAAAAREAGVPLVVFPGGTLNHFARGVGISDVDDALDAFLHGQLAEVDTAAIDGRLFLNTASFGSYSSFVEERERLESRVGKWPAMMLALVRVLRTYEPLEVTLDGEQRRVWMIFVGNCVYDPPGLIPTTRNRLDDDLLDVRLVAGPQGANRARLLFAAVTGRLFNSSSFERRLTRRLEVTTSQGSLTLAADGEIFDGPGSFVIEKHHTRLAVYTQVNRPVTS